MSARILVIEDNITNMELMVYLLDAFGYEVETARDGKDGLQKAFRWSPDLIICDLEMPEVNGYEVALQLRSVPAAKKIPLIAVTAYAMVGDRDKILAAGFDGYLPKPIYPDIFVKQIEGFLDIDKHSGHQPDVSGAAEALPTLVPSCRAALLVVDDSPVNLSLLRSTFEPSGYKVVSAATVQDAMEAIACHSFDLVLSDLHMPCEDGIALLRRMKADPKRRSIPFVLFTASSSGHGDIKRELALQLGADRFLSRPLDPQSILSLVEEVLASTRSANGHCIGR